MKPNVLVINAPYDPEKLIYSYKYNLFYSGGSDLFSDNIRILLKIFKLRGAHGSLLADRTATWKLIKQYYY